MHNRPCLLGEQPVPMAVGCVNRCYNRCYLNRDGLPFHNPKPRQRGGVSGSPPSTSSPESRSADAGWQPAGSDASSHLVADADPPTRAPDPYVSDAALMASLPLGSRSRPTSPSTKAEELSQSSAAVSSCRIVSGAVTGVVRLLMHRVDQVTHVCWYRQTRRSSREPGLGRRLAGAGGVRAGRWLCRTDARWSLRT